MNFKKLQIEDYEIAFSAGFYWGRMNWYGEKVRGHWDYMYQRLSDECFLINAGSDVDLPGLRKSKELENPIVLYKIYRVVFAGES